MAHTVQRNRKTKKSYTLSPESVAFLEALRKKRSAPSVSSVLDEIVQTFQRGQAKKAVERAVADYYASLSAEDFDEQAKWGDFALAEFTNEAGETPA